MNSAQAEEHPRAATHCHLVAGQSDGRMPQIVPAAACTGQGSSDGVQSVI